MNSNIKAELLTTNDVDEFSKSFELDNINKIIKSPLLLKDNNISNVEDLKEKIEKLKAIIISKEKFIRDLGESKDEDEREFEAYKKNFNEYIEQNKLKISQLVSEINDLKSELLTERLLNKKLIEDLKTAELSLMNDNEHNLINKSNESNLSLEEKNENLQNKLTVLEKDYRLSIDENLSLREKLEQMQNACEEQLCEIENLRKINLTLRDNFKDSQEKILELEAEIHLLKVNPEIAKQGNSLFGEVIEGRENQEKEMEQLFREKERFRKLYDKSLKLLHENTMKTEMVSQKELLSAPSLDIFKKTVKRLKVCQHENETLKNRIQTLEQELLSIETKQLLNENSVVNSERRLQILFIEDELRSKQRFELRIRELEIQNRDLLDRILTESTRASSIPLLENRIECLNKIITEYKKSEINC